MWNECCLGCLDEGVTAWEESLGEESEGSFLVSDRRFPIEGFYDLFEVSILTIEEMFYDLLWKLEMTRVSIVSLPFLILDVDHSYKPVFTSYAILIDSPFHPDKVVSIWYFISTLYSSIFCSISQFFESHRHIWNS